MPGQRLPTRQVREVVRLKHVCGHSGHQIAAMIGGSRYTMAEYLRRAAVVDITWPVPPELDDAALERKLKLKLKLPRFGGAVQAFNGGFTDAQDTPALFG